jgi:hypothetical protein
MSFVQRELRFTFSGENVGSFSAAGLRAYASIQAYTGKLGVAGQIRVWGLSLAQMNAYSSQIAAAAGINEFNLALEAGDVGGQMTKVLDGAIWRSYIDLANAPESAFNVSVAGTIYQAATPMASQSHAGAQDAETLIQSICNVAGLQLVNTAGAHAVLRNMSTYGSPVDQIERIARAAGFQVYFSGSTVSIWPSGTTRDETVITTGPNDGMVGYPEWWEAGLIVRTLFNPEIQVGRSLQVKSSIPKANGTWQIINVQHELATMLRNGPWFTTAVVSTGGSNG